MFIFLAGEVQSIWRDELITTFKQHTFFNPKKKNWSRSIDGPKEREAIRKSDLVIALTKGCGKGTRSEILYCHRINKQLVVCKTVEEIINYLSKTI
jgi:hypothetical protein